MLSKLIDRSESDWRELLSGYDESSSIKDFCISAGISKGSFYKWRRIFLQSDVSDSTQFVPVEISSDGPLESSLSASGFSRGFKIKFSSGLFVDFASGCDFSELSELLSRFSDQGLLDAS
jgi:hypothetical protein